MNTLFTKTKNIIATNKAISLAVVIVIVFIAIISIDNKNKPASQGPNQENTVKETSNSTSTESGTNKPNVSTSKPAVIPKNTVYFDGVRFTPSVLKTKAGETVTFANKSSKSMRIKYAETASGTPTYNEFIQERTVGKNGIYQFVFTKRGTWNYYNMNNVKAVGSVVVE